MISKKVILILFAFCCLLFAVLFYTKDPVNTQTTNEQELFIPGLEKSLADVNSILIDSSEESIVINKVEEHWEVASKDDYPANVVAIRQLLYGIAELEILEVKTSNELLLGEIGLANDDEDSVRIRFNDEENNSIADVLFGKSQPSLSGDGKNWFVRQFKSPQSWLVKGYLNLYKSTDQWLNKTILALNPDQLQQIELHPETDEVVQIIKQQNNYTLANLIEGETADSFKLEQIADSISNLQLDNVRVRADTVLSGDVEAINVQTADGLIILILLTDVEEGWIVLQAIAASADDKVNEKAETYNQLWTDWEYQIPKYKVEQLLNKKQDLLQAEETT